MLFGTKLNCTMHQNSPAHTLSGLFCDCYLRFQDRLHEKQIRQCLYLIVLYAHTCQFLRRVLACFIARVSSLIARR